MRGVRRLFVSKRLVPTKPFLQTAKLFGNARLMSLAAQGINLRKRRAKMSSVEARLSSRASAETTTKYDSFLPVAMFCALGLLLSLSVLILDQHISGDWF